MIEPNRLLSRRQQSFVLYSMYLTGEVKMTGWTMQVERSLLQRALDGLEGLLVLTVSDLGLSIRSRAGRADVAGIGFWASPVSVTAGRLRQAAARESDPYVQLEFGNGRLTLNARSMAAREI
jgi:hypothetical protein